MTAAELIAHLRHLDPQAEVRIARPEHDFWRHVSAVAPCEVQETLIDASDHITTEEDAEKYSSPTYRRVFVLR